MVKGFSLAGFLGLSILASSVAAAPVYSFAVVPQQSPSKTAKIWGPILQHIWEQSGIQLVLQSEQDIPAFEHQLRLGKADFAYMNPYHFTVFHETQDYQALAKAKDHLLQGIIVVRTDSPFHSLQDLEGHILAFPSPGAFAASILPRAYMKQQGISIHPEYVSSHDSVYLNVAKGRYPAGGGVLRTLDNFHMPQRKELKILWRTEQYTPHAIATHPRVPLDVSAAVQQSLLALHQSPAGRTLLEAMKIPGFEAASNTDWDEVRTLGIRALEDNQ